MTIDRNYLETMAAKVRIDIIRQIHAAGSGHPGGSLSAADILTYLYFAEMKVDPADPDRKERDRFVLSKGHAAPALYAVLAEKGYFPVEELLSLRKLGSMLQGHPDRKHIPGVDMSTGSLGQGISAAVGMALANHIDGSTGRVYALLGDGELQEGLVWEAAMAASHYGLDDLTAFVDWNGLQIDGKNEDVMTVTPIDDKFRAFGWDVRVIEDGNDMLQVCQCLDTLPEPDPVTRRKPIAIIANTEKGHDVDFMAGNVKWHGGGIAKEQYDEAIASLDKNWKERQSKWQ